MFYGSSPNGEYIYLLLCVHRAVFSLNVSPKLYWLFLGSRHSRFQASSFYRGDETFFDQYRNCKIGNFGSQMAHSRSAVWFAKPTMLNNSCCLIFMMIPHMRIFSKPSGFANAWLALNTTLPCYCKGLSTKPAQRELGSYHWSGWCWESMQSIWVVLARAWLFIVHNPASHIRTQKKEGPN